MYAKEENGVIKIYVDVPNSYGNIAGGYHKLSQEQHKEDGFYPYVKPEITEYQRLNPVDFDAETKTFTHDVIDFTEEEIITHKRAMIPTSISRMNLKIQLLLKGITIDSIISTINSIDESVLPAINKQIAIIKLNEASTFDRNNSDFVLIANLLQLTEGVLDSIFTDGNENII